jgi:hypothetical protein
MWILFWGAGNVWKVPLFETFVVDPVSSSWRWRQYGPPKRRPLGQLQHDTNNIMVKKSRNRPGVAQSVPGGLGYQIFMTREGGEVVSLTHRPPLSPGMFLVLIFTRGWVDSRAMVRSEGNTSLKNPVTPPGIDPGTVGLVAQRLNHYATPGPDTSNICSVKLYTHTKLTIY